MIVIIMGICACGKTTVGKQLADKLKWKFYDADDYHSDANKAKMARGQALTDEDRRSWLNNLAELARKMDNNNECALVSCSALKLAYRDVFRGTIGKNLRFAYLQIDEQTAVDRLSARAGHFFNPTLLRSQLECLQEPNENAERDVITIDGRRSIDAIIEALEQYIMLQTAPNVIAQ